MAKPKLVPPPAPPVIEEEDEPDCPRCPPVGAPAWMATFADMATLLMAFFVLILSFANFDEVSFNKMTGTLRETFGVKLIEIMPNPDGSTTMEMTTPPGSDPQAPEDVPDAEGESGAPPTESNQENGAAAPKSDPAMQQLTEALQEALGDGEVTVMGENGAVTVRLPEGAGAGELAQALANAASDIAGAGQGKPGQSEPGLAPGAAKPEQSADATGGDPQTGEQNGPGDGGASAESKAAIAEARLKVALREIEGEGLVDVEQKDGKVVVTVGAGGSFGSGSADLTEEAREIMSRIALSAMSDGGQITVTGHTDNVALSGGQYVDNWGLAAARASSVVRELAETGGVDPARLSAVSKGDSNPVSDNTTEEGRAANRRIEIVFDYANSAPAP